MEIFVPQQRALFILVKRIFAIRIRYLLITE